MPTPPLSTSRSGRGTLCPALRWTSAGPVQDTLSEAARRALIRTSYTDSKARAQMSPTAIAVMATANGFVANMPAFGREQFTESSLNYIGPAEDGRYSQVRL